MNRGAIVILTIIVIVTLIYVVVAQKKSADEQIISSARSLHQDEITKEIHACNQGYGPACMTMGKIYENGYYFQPKDPRKAMAFFEKGCNVERDFEESCTLLAELLSLNKRLQLTSMTSAELHQKICNFSDETSLYCSMSD